ncbi:hypothetical protein VPIG_00048 [Vibrio phage PWH3a-P1]|uniref:hypothetical protein n=1 Tax=Vibrio phage PWH3a-P1 TaxID=754058 RepID=UPI0002C050C4|nr:hypothetical protein VPIG_00048 [Vibrio phage PWH3a-P1]AGH31906.1 hypothetical protein VPIG_00048 [Vibrio phage PWH3a-P1]
MRDNYYDPDKLYHKSNRDQATDPKSHTLHWCDVCDRDMVHAGEKCSVCGHRDESKRRKK